LNPDYTAITGYSMGGYATYKLAAQYPDLFAKAAPVNGAEAAGAWLGPGTAPVPYSGTADETPTITLGMLDSFRNIPVLMWTTGEDELVPYPSSQAMADRLDQLGYRYEFDNFQPGDHLSLAFKDQYQPLADWLGTDTVDRNPSHVTFVASPRISIIGASSAIAVGHGRTCCLISRRPRIGKAVLTNFTAKAGRS